MIISLFLREDGSICIVPSIGFHLELSVGIGMHEYWSLTDSQLEKFKGVLLVFSPLPGLILLEKVMQRLGDVGETWNPSVIKVYKTDELVHPSNRGRAFPIMHVGDLFVLHLESVTANIDTEELHLFLMEFAFLRIAIESGVLEALEHR